jgi:hypothetical protein
MKYSYELKYEQTTQTIKQKKFVVYELVNETVKASHSVNFIIMKKNSAVFYRTTLERMYNWLKENHPELLI